MLAILFSNSSNMARACISAVNVSHTVRVEVREFFVSKDQKLSTLVLRGPFGDKLTNALLI